MCRPANCAPSSRWPSSAASRAPRRRCHLSQPAFSALIRSLEDSAGRCACSTAARAMSSPRAEGREFERPARRVLAEFDGAVLGVRDQRARARRGRVSIALLPSLAAGWLPRGAGRLSRGASGHRAGGQPTCCPSPASSACAPASADFALAATRAETPELRAEPFCSDALPPGLPRPTTRWRRRRGPRPRRPGRPSPSCTCRAPAACASTWRPRCTRGRCAR